MCVPWDVALPVRLPGSTLGLPSLLLKSSTDCVAPALPGRQQGTAGDGAGTSLRKARHGSATVPRRDNEMSELERGGRAGSPVGLTAPWWDFVWGTECTGGGVRCDQWVVGGRDSHQPPGPAALESEAPLDLQHPGRCPRAGGCSCESGQATPPPHLAKREKRKSWGRPARGKRVSSSYRGPRTSSPMCGVWG